MIVGVFGQEPSAPATPDFTPAFKQLVALGMPPLDAGAKWSKLPDRMIGGMGDYEFQQMFRTLKGNGWVLPSPDGKTRILPAGQLEVATLDDGTGETTKKEKAPKITEADPEKDLQAIRKFLEKKKAENSRFSGSYELNVGGRLLLLASQFHQTGKTQLANELTAAVFDTWSSREAVVDAAVSALADPEFEKITQEFFASGDWTAYHTSLTAVQKKFPRGWPTGQALNLLQPQIAKQVAGEAPPTLSIPGTPLDPRALEAVARLLVKPKPDPAKNSDEALLKRAGIKMSDIPAAQRARILESLRMSGESGNDALEISQFWIFEKPSEEPNEESLLTPLTALKIDALPILAAMLDDPYLTPYPQPNQHGYSSYFSSSDSEAERLERAYQSMQRPASRGDIARMMLEYAVPRGERDSEETDTETLREQVMEFWKKHRKSTREDLAIAFLQEGDSSQQRQSAEILTSATDPKYIKAFEDYILNADSALSHYQLVKNYLTARKAAAKPFFDSYAKVVREQTANAGEDNNDLPWEAREAGGPEKILKNLESFVGGKSFRAIAKDIANGDPKDARGALRALMSVMDSAPYTKQLYALLEGAVTTDKPEVRATFLQTVFQISSRMEASENEDAQEEDEEENATEEGPKTHPALRKLPEAEIKAWLKLMADQRPSNEETSNQETKTSVGEVAAVALCYSVGSDYYGRLYQAGILVKRKPTELFLEHAEAILSGKEPPDLPDASRVKPERLRAIVDAAGAKPPLEIQPYLETLTPDERAAWIDWRNDPEEIEIPKSVKDLGAMIFRRSEDKRYPYPAVTDTAPIDVGFTVSMESIKAAAEAFAKDPQKLSLTTIWMSTAEFGPGIETSAIRFPQPEKDPKDPEKTPISCTAFAAAAKALEEHESADGCIVFAIGTRGRGDMLELPWIAEKGKLTTSEEQLAQIEEYIKQILARQTEERIYFSIQILSKADADKIRAMKTESSDDSMPLLPPIE